MNVHTQIFVQMYLSISQSRMAESYVDIFNFLRNCLLFSKVVALFHIPNGST